MKLSSILFSNKPYCSFMRGYLKYAFLIPVCLLLLSVVGCGEENSVDRETAEVKVLSFRLGVSGFPTRSEMDEDAIDYNDVFLCAYNKSGNKLQELSNDEDGAYVLEITQYDIYDGIVILAFANWSYYDISSDDLQSKENIEQIAELTYEIHKQEKPSHLPMVGMVEISSGDIEGDAISKTIKLDRALAKIEIVDETKEGITGVSMPGANIMDYILTEEIAEKFNITIPTVDHNENSQPQFTEYSQEQEDGKSLHSFYTYVPPMLLEDPAESSNREIKLTMNGGEERTIYIGTGSDVVEELTGGADDGSWDRLKANNLYRITVTGSATEEENIPAIGDGTTLRICWIPNTSGLKFTNGINIANLFPDLGKVNIQNTIATQNHSTNNTNREIYGIKIGNYIYWDFELNNQIYKNLVYAILDTENITNKHLSKMRNLYKDVIWYNEIGNNKIECWLTSIDIKHYYNISNYSNFPTDHKYRLYINKEQEIKYGFTIRSYSGTEITEESKNVSQFSKNNKRDYYFYDIDMPKDIYNPDLFIYNISEDERKEIFRSDSRLGIQTTDIYIERIDGEVYYVIYAN